MISASLTRRISALSLSALVLATGLAAAAQDAHAVKPRKCPDGTIVGLRGRLRQNITVNFTGSAEPGELVEVEITGSTSATLAGRQVEVTVPA